MSLPAANRSQALVTGATLAVARPRVCLSILLLLAAAPAAAMAQEDASDWRWHINATIGSVGFTDATWNAIGYTMDSGWGLPPCGFGGFGGCPGPSGWRRGSRRALSATARLGLGSVFQLRALAAWARHGYLPIQNDSTKGEVRPSAVTLGVQGVVVAGPFWFGIGPTLNLGRVTVISDRDRNTRTGISAGLALGAGLTFPRSDPFFLEFAVEHRDAGSVGVGPTSVAGTSQPIPAMTVPLSHTVLSFGVGWRLAW